MRSFFKSNTIHSDLIDPNSFQCFNQKIFIMNKSKSFIVILISAIVLNSCQHPTDEMAESVAEYTESDTALAVDSGIPMNSTAADYQHPDKKFVRTASVSMEVNNVYKTTTRIENQLGQLGGFVAESNLNTHVISTETFPLDSDSAVEVRKYVVRNEMSLRVPETELSKFLILLGDEIQFLDYRNIEADDVTLKLLLSQNEQQRMNSTAGKLNELTKENGKISEKQNAISAIDQQQHGLNQEKINQLSTEDQIAFSTVRLKISEKIKVAETTVINTKSFNDKYRPAFWQSASHSLINGFRLFQTILIGLLYLWPVFLLGSLGWMFYRHHRRNRKSASV